MLVLLHILFYLLLFMYLLLEKDNMSLFFKLKLKAEY